MLDRFPGNYDVEKFLEIFSEEDYDAFCLAYMFTYRCNPISYLSLLKCGQNPASTFSLSIVHTSGDNAAIRDFEGGTLGLAWTGDLKNAGGVCEKNGVRHKNIFNFLSLISQKHILVVIITSNACV